MSEETSQYNIEQQEASHRYQESLRKIVDNPFVTDAAKEKRMMAYKVVQDIRAIFAEHNIPVLVDFFAHGSVGVGLSTPESDIDGYVVYEIVDSSSRDEIHRYISECFHHALGWKGDLKIVDVRDVIPMTLNDEVVSEVVNDPQSSSSQMLVDSVAKWFSPSIEETVGDPSSIEANRWRFSFLDQLVLLYPEEAETIWNVIRDRLKISHVLFEKITMGDASKRAPRVRNRIESVIIGRWLEISPEQSERVKKMLQNWRDNFTLPDLPTMLKAFDIQT